GLLASPPDDAGAGGPPGPSGPAEGQAAGAGGGRGEPVARADRERGPRPGRDGDRPLPAEGPAGSGDRWLVRRWAFRRGDLGPGRWPGSGSPVPPPGAGATRGRRSPVAGAAYLTTRRSLFIDKSMLNTATAYVVEARIIVDRPQLRDASFPIVAP